MPRLNPFAFGRTKLTKLWEAGIDGHVISLAWSDALGVIAAASAEGPIALFDAKTGQLRANLPGHGFGTSCIAWSADGQLLASGGQDGKIRLWGRHSFLPEPEKGAAADRNVCPTNQIKDMPAGPPGSNASPGPRTPISSPPPPARNCGSGTRLANCSANVPIIRPPSPTSPGSPASRSSLRPHTASCFSGVRSKPPPSAISPGKDRCSHLRGAPTANTSRPGRRIAASTFGF